VTVALNNDVLIFMIERTFVIAGIQATHQDGSIMVGIILRQFLYIENSVLLLL
jgi:hypothetical protein